MNNKIIWLLIFIVFILEGTWVHWLIPTGWYNGLQVAPHFVLVLVLFVSIIRNRHLGLFFGLMFGLMHDIVYASPMLGPHSFSMGLTAYAAGVMAKRLKITMISALFMISFSIVLYDVVNFLVFRMFRVIDVPFITIFSDFIMPTLLFNLLFAVIVYVPARRWMDRRKVHQEDESL
ncbi:MAG: rod shape-determining protein MreD [Paenibacillaceae bacterium]